MAFKIVDQGIACIREGKHTEGARLLRIAAKDDTLPADVRAVAYVWLAESRDDPAFRQSCYDSALDLAPENEAIRARWAAHNRPKTLPVDAAGPPPTIPESETAHGAPPPHHPQPGQRDDRIAGIINGAGGAGTGFFVTQDGLLVTTRHVVGGMQEVVVELARERRVGGRVLRSYPDMDLALVAVDVRVADVLPSTQAQHLPEGMALRAVAYNGAVVSGAIRGTQREMAVHWFPTDIRRLADAGGSPVLDTRGDLVGMLTRNVSRASDHVYGVRADSIYQVVGDFLREQQSAGRHIYCPHCGVQSRAAAAGYFYCEHCGAVMPHLAKTQRFSNRDGEAYYDPGARPCPHCGARSGSHRGHCLRCGREHFAG